MRGQRYAVGMVAVLVAILLGTVAPGWAADADHDGVDDAVDACPDTEIPEGVPPEALRPLHYALTDADATFHTFRGQESRFTTADTAGCSCTQIMALSGLGHLAHKFGCNHQVMKAFIAGVQAATGAVRREAGTLFPGDGAGHGAALSYTNNGDGTATDNNTGLMWEVKERAGGVHDVGNTYSWSTCCSTAPTADGTLFTEFLNALNNTCNGAGVTDCTATGNAACGPGVCGLAGHRDWRIPHIKELQSIVSYRVGLRPTIDPTFPGLTAASDYWSSTEASFPTLAWVVRFTTGFLETPGKINDLAGRAVRGGP